MLANERTIEDSAKRLADLLELDIANWTLDLRSAAFGRLEPSPDGEIESLTSQVRDLLRSAVLRELSARWAEGD